MRPRARERKPVSPALDDFLSARCARERAAVITVSGWLCSVAAAADLLHGAVVYSASAASCGSVGGLSLWPGGRFLAEQVCPRVLARTTPAAKVKRCCCCCCVHVVGSAAASGRPRCVDLTLLPPTSSSSPSRAAPTRAVLVRPSPS
ncbi:hypothetical protein HPB50_020946 [Hyalomma asiaticum]|uniref:Uncharacterized protein n=1 Tax=Hyalomma asiaticum TaxID=266040 RepID=A0ACB7SYI7_HYAAI|nr:hypothetical protein HPB50_020946 [Hyalomma asiaticum]